MQVEQLEMLLLKQAQLITRAQQQLEVLFGMMTDAHPVITIDGVNGIEAASKALLNLIEGYHLLLPQDDIDAEYFVENTRDN